MQEIFTPTDLAREIVHEQCKAAHDLRNLVKPEAQAEFLKAAQKIVKDSLDYFGLPPIDMSEFNKCLADTPAQALKRSPQLHIKVFQNGKIPSLADTSLCRVLEAKSAESFLSRTLRCSGGRGLLLAAGAVGIGYALSRITNLTEKPS